MGLQKLGVLLAIFVSSCTVAQAEWQLNGELIYATAQIDELEFALHASTVVFEGPSLSGSGPLKNIDFGWDPGVRLGVGCDYGCGWSLDLIATYLHSKASGSDEGFITAGNDFIHPLWFQSFVGFRAAHVDAEWNLDFVTLDLVGSRSYCFWNCSTFTPHFGLRSLFIKQKYDIDYSNVLFSLMGGGSLNFPEANVDLSSRYLAIGLTTGTDFEIPLWCNFSFNGGIAGSLVYGKSNVNERIDGAFPLEDSLVPTEFSIPNHEYNLRANLESEIGLSYITCLCGCPLVFSAGYFFSLWFDQNDFYNLIFTSSNLVDLDLADNFATIEHKQGNLQIQGVTLGATLQF